MLQSIETVPKIYYSNRIETLQEALQAQLFVERANPFARRLVLISSQAMEQWLRFRFAESAGIGVCTGLELLFVPTALSQLCAALGIGLGPASDRISLSFHIEAEIRELIRDPDLDNVIWAPLLTSLQISKERGHGWDRQVPALSQRLAELFERYSLYGEEEVLEWGGVEQWQKLLWCRLLEKNVGLGQLSGLAAQLDQADYSQLGPVQIHLFGLAFLPQAHQRIFQVLSQHLPFSQYVLSPCRAFWTDICSDRETRRLRLYWKDRGASAGQLHDLDQILRDRNGILANFGRLGREFHRSLEELGHESVERYELPQQVLDCGLYEEYLDDDIVLTPHTGELSLLEAVQADMLFLHRPDPREPVQCAENDRSLEVHKAPTHYREIEILYSNILRLVHSKQDSGQPLEPQDILVMAPDIGDYAPYIRALFGAEESLLNYQLMDVPLSDASPLLRAFTGLMDLAQSRWDLPGVLNFIENPVVAACFGWEQDALQRIRSWLKRLGVSWGIGKENRDEILERSFCKHGIRGSAQAGTWEHAFRRILRGMVQSLDSVGDSEEVLPFQGLDTSDTDLFSELLEGLRGLFDTLSVFADGTELSLGAWADRLEDLLDSYLTPKQPDSEWGRDREKLSQLFLKLHRSGVVLVDESFPFPAISLRLEQMMAQEMKVVNERLFHTVRFCSLVPMRSIPARAIFLLGMEKDSFPRQEESRSLNLLHGSSKADYCPSRVDFDRYLFLESLLSAREHCCISYASYNYKEKSETFPSTVVSELLHYLDQGYSLAGKTFSEARVYSHTFLAHDEDEARQFCKSIFRSARAVAAPKSAPRRFLQATNSAAASEKIVLNVRALSDAITNPIRYYLRQSLGIYLESEQLLSSDEPPSVNALGKYLWRDQILHGQSKRALAQLEQGSALPLGALKALAIIELEDERQRFQRNMEALGAGQFQPWRLLLSARCTEAEQLGPDSWACPALTIDVEGHGLVTIEGQVEDLGPMGVLSLGAADCVQVAKAWSRFVLNAVLVQQHDLPWGSDLGFLKTPKLLKNNLEDPQAALSDLLRHVLEVGHKGLPLMPQWIASFLKHDAGSGIRALEATMVASRWGASLPLEIQWLLAEGNFSILTDQYPSLVERSEELWGKSLRTWFPTQAKGWRS